MSKEIIRSEEELNNTLNEATNSINNIMLSSEANPWLLADFNDVIDFEEFSDVWDKLNTWSKDFKNRLNKG